MRFLPSLWGGDSSNGGSVNAKKDTSPPLFIIFITHFTPPRLACIFHMRPTLVGHRWPLHVAPLKDNLPVQSQELKVLQPTHSSKDLPRCSFPFFCLDLSFFVSERFVPLVLTNKIIHSTKGYMPHSIDCPQKYFQSCECWQGKKKKKSN